MKKENKENEVAFIWKEHHFHKIPYIYIKSALKRDVIDRLNQLNIQIDAKPVPLFERGDAVEKADMKEVKDEHGSPYSNSNNSVTYYGDELKWLDEEVASLIETHNNATWKFNPLNRIDNYEFVCFNEGGFIGEHTDISEIEQTDPKKYQNDEFGGRLLTQVIHFSNKGDDYEGGILQIKNIFGFWFDVPLLDKGDIVLFPSIFAHKVTPVTKGKRITLTTFLTGTYPQKIQEFFNKKESTKEIK